MADITMDEWLAAISDLESGRRGGPVGVTASEMAVVWGISRDAAAKRIKKLVMAGRAEYVGHKRITRIDGLTGFAPAYRLTKKHKEK